MAEVIPERAFQFVGESELISVPHSRPQVEVYKIVSRDLGILYLKIALNQDTAYELRREVEILNWLRGRIRAPEVMLAGEDSGRFYFLSPKLDGWHGSDALGRLRKEDVVEQAARQLRQIHLLNANEWPLPMDSESVPVGDDDYTNLVITHGDYTISNLLFGITDVAGIVDWGRSGISDRYLDISSLLQSFKLELGQAYEDLFLSEYGLIECIDTSKVEYYQRLKMSPSSK